MEKPWPSSCKHHRHDFFNITDNRKHYRQSRNEPFGVREAEKLGFKTLIDVPSQKIPFHWNGVLTKESALKARRPVFSRLTLALTEAIYVYKTEKEWTKALIGRYLKVNDPESLERAYNSLKMILPETPSMPEGVDVAR